MRLLIKTDDDLKSSVKVPDSLNLKEISQELLIAQVNHIEPILGSSFLNELLNKVHGSVPISGVIKEILPLVKAPMTQIAIAQATDLLNVRAEAGGFKVNTGDNHEVASQARVIAYKNENFKQAQQGINRLVQYLIDNVDDEGLELYKDSSAYTDINTGLVANSIEFSKYIHFQLGHFLFKKIRPTVVSFEEDTIQLILGKPLYDFIVEKKAAGEDLTQTVDSVETDYSPILPIAQKAIALSSLSESYELMNIQQDMNGFYLEFERQPNSNKNRSQAKDDQRFQFINQLKGISEKEIDRLKNHLLSNSYPLWENEQPSDDADSADIYIKAKSTDKIYPGFGI